MTGYKISITERTIENKYFWLPCTTFLNPQGYIENFLCPGHFLGPKQRQWLMMGTLAAEIK
jgi:hypothetical protein